MRRIRSKIGILRSNSIVKYGLTNLLPRSVAILIILIITPIAIQKLGVADYGLWALATLIPNLITSSDFGITYGIVNEMSRINSEQGDLRNQRERLLGLARLLTLIAVGWLILGTAGLSWYAFSAGHASGIEPDRVFTVLLLALGIFTLGISPSLWSRVQLAQERGHEYLRWEGIGKIVSFLASLLVLLLIPNLYLLVVASLLPNILVNYANARQYIRTELGPPHGPRWSIRKTLNENRMVFAAGKYFFIFQLTFLVGSAIDPFIVNSLLSTKDVAYLTLARRPFDALPLTVTLFSAALWPIFYQLNANNKLEKLKKVLFRITAGSSGILVILSLLIIIFFEPIYSYLGQGKITVSQMDLFWIAIQTLSITIILILNHYMSAVNLLRSQMWVQITASTVGIITKFLALKYGGLSAYFPTASIIYFTFALVPMAWLTIGHIQRRISITI